MVEAGLMLASTQLLPFKALAPPQGDCATEGSTVSGLCPYWRRTLTAWFSTAGRPRGGRYRPEHRQLEYCDERIERLFDLQEGQVQGCLHVIGGRPVSYGVRVGL